MNLFRKYRSLVYLNLCYIISFFHMCKFSLQLKFNQNKNIISFFYIFQNIFSGKASAFHWKALSASTN